MEELDLRVTDAARAYIADLMLGQEAGMLPAIFFASGAYTHSADGALVSEDPAHWYLSVYTQAQIEQFSKSYATLGRSLVYSAQGLVICIPQPQLAAALAGKTLDVQGRRVCIG